MWRLGVWAMRAHLDDVIGCTVDTLAKVPAVLGVTAVVVKKGRGCGSSAQSGWGNRVWLVGLGVVWGGGGGVGADRREVPARGVSKGRAELCAVGIQGVKAKSEAQRVEGGCE